MDKEMKENGKELLPNNPQQVMNGRAPWSSTDTSPSQSAITACSSHQQGVYCLLGSKTILCETLGIALFWKIYVQFHWFIFVALGFKLKSSGVSGGVLSTQVMPREFHFYKVDSERGMISH